MDPKEDLHMEECTTETGKEREYMGLDGKIMVISKERIDRMDGESRPCVVKIL